jgi:hypothetical protein
MGKDSDVPQPGPARLAKGAGPDEWLEQAKQCKYLPEADMKRLCEIVKECLMEGKSFKCQPLHPGLPRSSHRSWHAIIIGEKGRTWGTRV